MTGLAASLAHPFSAVAPAALRAVHREPLLDALPASRHNLITRHGERLAYYADHSASGRPLVLIHSINAAPSAFEVLPLFEHYRATRPVYAPDLPGFGFSERGDCVYSPERFAAALSDFLREVVKVPADVIALSLGSEFAARTALLEPELVRSLTLISPTGFGRRSRPKPLISDRIHRVLRLPLLSQGLFNLLTVRPSIGFFLRRSFVGTPSDDMIDYAYATSHQPGARYAPLYFLSGHLFTKDAPQQLYSQVQQPVLVIYDQDPNVGFEQLSGFLSTHPHWQTARITPSRGLPHWEKLPETAQALDRFWA